MGKIIKVNTSSSGWLRVCNDANGVGGEGGGRISEYESKGRSKGKLSARARGDIVMSIGNHATKLFRWV